MCTRSLALTSPECLDERTWGHRKVSGDCFTKVRNYIMVFPIKESSRLSDANEDHEIDMALTRLGTGTGADISYSKRL